MERNFCVNFGDMKDSIIHTFSFTCRQSHFGSTLLKLNLKFKLDVASFLMVLQEPEKNLFTALTKIFDELLWN